MLLVYTSFLFMIVHVYGLYMLHWTGPAFFLLTALSASNHYIQNKEHPWIPLQRIDTIYSHLLMLFTVIEASSIPLYPSMYIYWSCVYWIAYIFKISNLSYDPYNGTYWHSTVHIAGVIGTCALLYTIQTINM